MRKFTEPELQAMLEAMRKLAVNRAISTEVYRFTTHYHSLGPVGLESGVSITGPRRDRLREITQYLARCPCFAQYGEQHTIAFLRRYAEIALKAFRADLTT